MTTLEPLDSLKPLNPSCSGNSADTMICVENLGKKYRLGQLGHRSGTSSRLNAGENEFWALKDVSFTAVSGEKIGIIGYNGAGKSTLLKLISRVTGPTEGFIGLNGRVASLLEVGTGFHPELTGKENIYLNGAILGMKKKEIDSKLDKIIEFSECSSFIDTPVKHYSSGMRVKLAFSVAAYLDSEILIMDEVLAVGDAAFQKKCLERINEVSQKENRTVLYVSHNMNTISSLCKRTLVLDRGKLVYDGPSDNGISMYLGNSRIYRKKTDYSQKDHEGSVTGDVEIKGFSLCKDSNIFSCNEKLEFELFYCTHKNSDRLRFRFTIMQSDGTPVATSVSRVVPCMVVPCMENGTHTIKISTDLSGIAPGDYRLRIIAFEANPDGTQIRNDCIPSAFAFCLKDENPELNMKWSTKSWGCHRLPVSETIVTGSNESVL